MHHVHIISPATVLTVLTVPAKVLSLSVTILNVLKLNPNVSKNNPMKIEFNPLNLQVLLEESKNLSCNFPLQ